MSNPQDAPSLDTDYPLTEEQIAHFREHGHVCLRGICPPEAIEYYREAINRVTNLRRKKLAPKPIEERDTYGKAFLQMSNIWEDGDDDVKRFVMARRFAKVAAQLVGEEGMRLYHDQALYKEGHGGLTPWHQDQHYWPLDTNHCITMWMPLVDVTRNMGTMNFASGSHQEGYLGNIPISDESEAMFERYCKDKGFGITNYGDMAAGDATFHNGWTLHGAPGNETDTIREVMTIIWHPDGIEILPVGDERWNDNRRTDLRTWFPGQKPGEPAVSPKNPLVYDAAND